MERVFSGVQLDDGCFQQPRGFYLPFVRIDEQRHADAGVAEARYDGFEALPLARGIQPTFGRNLLPAFRNEAHGMRPNRQGNRHHVVCGSHFEIDWRGNGPLQARNVLIANVAPVLAQMQGYAIGARAERQPRRPDRIGMRSTPRVADRRNMIDVYSKTDLPHTKLPCYRRWPAIVAASFIAEIRLPGSASPRPAMSSAVP